MEDFIKLRDWIDINKLNWVKLSANPNAIYLLEQNLDNIDWENLSRNPNAISILEKNVDKVDWDGLSENPNIFTYDYDRLSFKKRELHRELIEYFWNPKTIQTFCMKYGYNEDDHDFIEIYSSCFQL